MRTLLAASLLVAAAAVPATASAAAITTDRQCYAPGSMIGYSMSGYPASAQADLYGGPSNDYLADVVTGPDGAFAGQFAGGALGNLRRETFTLSATTDDATVSAATSYIVTARTVTMTPSVARPAGKVRFTARGFFSTGTLYAHYAYSRTGLAKKTLVKTVKLGKLSGPCGDLTTKKVRQLPIDKPRRGVYEIQFDTSYSYHRLHGDYADRTVFAK
jgi:hypothetical protein